ncbi:MAG: hypothetical protein GW855_07810 [Erythrobacter sp.]|nr:hypothetical protein [Erythrobacter sp.]NCQ62443.1 hypothetical protein [Alphaproteobacteria bacterium]
MGTIRVSDHALLRFMERSAALPVEQLRASLEASLDRAHSAAAEIGASDYLIHAADGLFLVRDDVVVTVLEDEDARSTFFNLRRVAKKT